jgi:hypothetical protein
VEKGSQVIIKLCGRQIFELPPGPWREVARLSRGIPEFARVLYEGPATIDVRYAVIARTLSVRSAPTNLSNTCTSVHGNQSSAWSERTTHLCDARRQRACQPEPAWRYPTCQSEQRWSCGYLWPNCHVVCLKHSGWVCSVITGSYRRRVT